MGAERGGFTGHGQVQIDAVEQRPGEFVAVALDLFRGAAATPRRLPQITARAGIHGSDQLKTRRKTHAVTRTGDHYKPRFHGLSEHFVDFTVELGQFIQK